MSENKSNRGISVLLAGSVLQLFLGMLYTWSVFANPITDTFGWNVQDVKFTVNIMFCCYSLGVLASGKLQAKMKAPYIVLIGGLMMAAGVFFTSFLPTCLPVWSIWLTYGVVGGFGVGLAYNTIISCSQKWFPKKRGLATGICVFAFGFSSVIFAPLVEYMTQSDAIGLILTLRLLAAVFLVVTLMLFRFVKQPKDMTDPAVDSGTQMQYTTKQMLKTADFYFMFFAMMFFPAAFLIINPSLRLLAPVHGLSMSFGVTLVMIAGISNSAGRLVVPLLGDKIGRQSALFGTLFITAVGTASLCVAKGGLFVVIVAALAFSYGGASSLFPIIVADRFGLKSVGANYGAVMVGFMASVLLFPTTIGQLNTGQGADNTVKYITLASVAAIGALLVIALMIRARKD